MSNTTADEANHITSNDSLIVSQGLNSEYRLTFVIRNNRNDQWYNIKNKHNTGTRTKCFTDSTTRQTNFCCGIHQRRWFAFPFFLSPDTVAEWRRASTPSSRELTNEDRKMLFRNIWQLCRKAGTWTSLCLFTGIDDFLSTWLIIRETPCSEFLPRTLRIYNLAHEHLERRCCKQVG